jgi:hypothetical protein
MPCVGIDIITKNEQKNVTFVDRGLSFDSALYPTQEDELMGKTNLVNNSANKAGY